MLDYHIKLLLRKQYEHVQNNNKDHQCTVNNTGSSDLMEKDAGVIFCHSLYNIS